MTRYLLAAAALKAMASTPPTRVFYRRVIGNVFGARKRAAASLSPAYLERSRLLIQNCRKYQPHLDGGRAAEIGTGWIHFYSIALRMLYDTRITLVDAWDNRQFAALQKQLAQVEPLFRAAFEPSAAEIERALEVLETVRTAKTLDAMYQSLGFEYVLDPSLDSLPDASYDLIFSFHVLEHIETPTVRRHVHNMARLLRPGGMQIHQIGLDDHLSHYDQAAHSKQFLCYSDRTWSWFFQNRLQYVNRLQQSEWHRLFVDSGMTPLEVVTEKCNLDGIAIHPRFAAYDRDDLACVTATFVMRKGV